VLRVPLGPRHRLRIRDLRLAVAPLAQTPPGGKVAKSIRQQIERVAAQASDAGAKVEERLPDIDWKDLFALFGDLVATVTGLFSPGAHLRDEQRTLAWYFEALERRDRLAAVWHRFFAGFDALLLPPARTTAFTHRESDAPVDVDGEAVSYQEIAGASAICNVTGLPGLVAPAGFDADGLPIGIQLVGPLWSEMRLLGIARALEQAGILPGFQPPPPE
jgi:amidase